jgi:DHA1 family multidrug resistance protein-like MFS transporter
MRRLTVFLWGIAAVQAFPFPAVAPLLPSFEEDLGLSKAQAGLLVGMYPIGLVVAALPVGLLAARVGVKRSALASLFVLAIASVAFGLVDSYGELLATRFLQGAAAVLCYASGLAWLVGIASRERRGEMIGLFSGAAAAGQVLGPVVGGVAVLAGRAGAFASMAGFAVLLAIVGSLFPDPTRDGRQLFAPIRRAHSSGVVLGGLWLVALPGVLLGTIFVLAPLRLDRLGWGPVGIAGTFVVAASVGVLARPLIGRWADRRGLSGALQLLLLASIPVTLVIPWVGYPWVLSLCVVFAITLYGVIFGPAMALVSRAYEEAGIAQVLGFALMSLTTGIGLLAGSAAGGAVAHLAGDWTAYASAAGTCLATFVGFALRTQTRRQ